jgi:phosphotransferase system HPr-like phosphotransfer protein
MTLAALPGTELLVEVDGDDAAAALPVLVAALEAPSADDMPG